MPKVHRLYMHWKLLIYLTVLCSTLVQLYAGDACASDDSSSGVLKLRADIIAAAKNPDQASESKRLAHVMQTYALAGIRLRLKQDAQKLSSTDARALFEAANAASFYTDDAGIANDQVKLLKVLEGKRLMQPSDIVNTYGALVAARDFNAAQAFFHNYSYALPRRPPKLIPLKGREAGMASELVVNTDGAVLKESMARLEPTTILVVGDPLCAYTQQAADDISRSSPLRKLMRDYSRWIAPPSRQPDFSVYAQWNAHHPDAHFSLVYRRSDWRMINHWETPAFYFFKNGRVVRQVTGWPRGGRQQELLSAAKAIGLPTD
ncbi:hypothetical protein KIP65_03980 [Xanthomonas campestris pv. campestris]|uniref:hypothetical protein n=2 Tax=Xanthomonas campestris TaxID=339 RepID=UPI00101AD7EE|nr:hypothetical protein [Xanthomonas campestris]MEA9809065.1 hypothetical protein [Xanthomonas campestris pv. raphani]MCF8795929.1 hypothetical protein [Xanthomonas campestris pv. campestris]MCF8815944.1 hypothetical protein [Xanthomonas campestris pv. campestris]MEB1884592.1 hypothetical protein [Xanthomonas campestris pv. campestris]WDK49733.1 hypothetical protein JH308_21495 [Xanthomonas campestris pv. campestris]